MKQTEKTAAASYYDSMHRSGRFWTALMILVMIGIPAGVCLIFRTMPNFSPAFWAAFLPILLMDIPSGIVELVTYAPLLGTGGTYLGFITGNLSNLKVPCAMNARDMMGTKVGTEENEIVSTISIATSAITTTIVLAVGVLLLVPLGPLLEDPTLLPAFKTVIPAMFGALGFRYAVDGPKAAILPLVLGIALFLIFPQLTSSVSIMVFVIAAVSLGVTFILYKKGIIK